MTPDKIKAKVLEDWVSGELAKSANRGKERLTEAYNSKVDIMEIPELYDIFNGSASDMCIMPVRDIPIMLDWVILAAYKAGRESMLSKTELN